VGEKGKCNTVLYVPVEEVLLPPAKRPALFNREDIIEVVVVSTAIPGKAKSHP